MVELHDHNGINSVKLTGRAFKNAPYPVIADATGGAGGTYTSAEQGIINENSAKINDILEVLRNLEIIRE